MDWIIASTTLVPDRSTEFTLTVVIAGIGIVLATLALLILIFNIFGNVVYKAQQKAEQKKTAALSDDGKKEGVPEPPKIKDEIPLPPPVTEGAAPEIVAAISAAVYMAEGEGAKITSIKRKKSPVNTRNPWAQAAVLDNTRPF